ncbi:hypothetical protein [Flaviaesturariibacter amylovorans]|uniref:Uncharacterized protein n=1 Tax=Flaviaesturariibacter amylovorans TaxID=1084520 RepID=A0ABP8GQN1_9BACT
MNRITEPGGLPQLTLGGLIEHLERIANYHQYNREGREEAEVRFDFAYSFPNGVHSWRGLYAELALDFCADIDTGAEAPKLSAFLTMLKETVGKRLIGWKGGEFLMDVDTPLWVAQPSWSGNTAVVGVCDEGYVIILLTAYTEY